MDTKKILLFAAILMVAISSLGAVSAGWFDFGSSNAQNISGISFNIPNDFKEVSQCESIGEKNFTGADVETKCYQFNVSDGTTIKVNELLISVISGNNLSEQMSKLDDYNNTTIAGNNGMFQESGGGSIGSHPYPSIYDFLFFKDGKLVNVVLRGWSPYVEPNQIEDIIK